jgi:hypothetical protein
MYAVASMNTSNYQDLSDLTDPCKREYCELHGYKFFVGLDDVFVLKTTPYTAYMNFNKMYYILQLFEKNPDIDWLLFCEGDAMITNLTIRIEDRIDNDYHFIVPVDRNNINAGNFLVRNTPEARAYLQMIFDKAEEYRDVEWAEQQVIIDTIGEYADIVKLVPQRYMNSYEQLMYDYCDISKDIFGTSGQWESGDWIVHWPGTHKAHRLRRAQEMNQLIVR